MAMDVTDATFQTEVIDRSFQATVVVDLWAEWCGPCKTLGPILEAAVARTNGDVVLAKVDVDANPAVAQMFRVQSIPAVFALQDGRVVDTFTGALPEHEVQDFVERLRPSSLDNALAALIAAGDENSLLRVLEVDPSNEDAIVALATILIENGRNDEALQYLARIPESDRTRPLAARARLGIEPDDDHDETLTALLDRVKTDDDARQQFVDILEVMGPHDPRTAAYRKQLTARLF